MSDDAREPFERVALRLHAVAIHLLRRLRQEDAAAGLGPARLSALSVLVFGGERTLGELAAAEQVRPPTMSRIVAALASEGLVERAADPTDRRAVHLHPTPAGRDLMERGRARRIARLLGILSTLERGERAALETTVAALERALAEDEQAEPRRRGSG